jgi:hypothetical protein
MAMAKGPGTILERLELLGLSRGLETAMNETTGSYVLF